MTTDSDACSTCGARHRHLYAPLSRMCRRCVLAAIESNAIAARQRLRGAFAQPRWGDEPSEPADAPTGVQGGR